MAHRAHWAHRAHRAHRAHWVLRAHLGVGGSALEALKYANMFLTRNWGCRAKRSSGVAKLNLAVVSKMGLKSGGRQN